MLNSVHRTREVGKPAIVFPGGPGWPKMPLGLLVVRRRSGCQILGPSAHRDDAAMVAVTLAAPGRAKDEETCRGDHVDFGEAGSSQRGLEICWLVEDLTDAKACAAVEAADLNIIFRR